LVVEELLLVVQEMASAEEGQALVLLVVGVGVEVEARCVLDGVVERRTLAGVGEEYDSRVVEVEQNIQAVVGEVLCILVWVEE